MIILKGAVAVTAIGYIFITYLMRDTTLTWDKSEMYQDLRTIFAAANVAAVALYLTLGT